MDKIEALRIILECAAYYEKNYAGKKLLYVCANNSLKQITMLESAFDRKNFMHLTGVKFAGEQRLSPDDFYTAAVKKRLSIHAFELSPDGTTELKLRVLPIMLKSQSLAANMSGDYNFRKPMLVTDKLAGGIKGCVGFVFDPQIQSYVPNTVLNEDIRINVCNQKRIILAYRKERTQEKYSERVYQARNINWNRISLPAEYAYLPLPDSQVDTVAIQQSAKAGGLTGKKHQEICNAVATYRDLQWSDAQIKSKLMQRFGMTEKEALLYVTAC